MAMQVLVLMGIGEPCRWDHLAVKDEVPLHVETIPIGCKQMIPCAKMIGPM